MVRATLLLGAWLTTFAGVPPLLAANNGNLQPPRSYERWVRPHKLSFAEQQLLRAIRAHAKARGQRLRGDARLGRVARSLLPSVPSQPGEKFPLSHAYAAARRLGWTDGQLAAVALRVPNDANLTAQVLEKLDNELGHVETNRVGLASTQTDTHTTVLLLLSRRLVDLTPLPSRTRRQQKLRLSGTIRTEAGADDEKARLVVERPDGTIERSDLTLSGHRFVHSLETGSTPGIIRIEVLVDRGVGPQIAAILPVGVERNPHTVQPARPPSVDNPANPPSVDNIDDVETAPLAESTEDAETALVALILGSRQAQGLGLLAQSSHLGDVACSHAHDMVDHDFFAHVSSTTGDLTDRLHARAVPFVRAVENIAIAESAEAAFQQWNESPAHRGNLLDPDVTSLGVGVAVGRRSSRTELYVVVVLARPPDGGGSERLRQSAMDSINGRRAALRLEPLRQHHVLDELALRHSREIAASGVVDSTSPVRGGLADTVLDEVDVSEAAADVYLANSVDAVIESPHLRERYSRIGVGVFRDSSRASGQLWITVIYAND